MRGALRVPTAVFGSKWSGLRGKMMTLRGESDDFGGESDDLKSSSPGERWRSSEPQRGEALTGFAPNGIFGGTDSRVRGRGAWEERFPSGSSETASW